MPRTNKKGFIKIFTKSVREANGEYIQQMKLAKNLTELRKKVQSIEFFDDSTFKVVTKDIICEGVNFGSFILTFNRNDPKNVWADGGKLRWALGSTDLEAMHMNIYQKNGKQNPMRVCLSEALDKAIAQFYKINDISGVVQVVLTMFEGNKLTDGLGQWGWFQIKLKNRCKTCDDRTHLNNDNLCVVCAAQMSVVG